MEVITGMVEVHLFRINNGMPEFLLIKRSEKEIYPGLWQMVSGSIEKDEKAYEAAIREIKEETNLEVEKLWSAPNVNSFYSAEKDAIILIPVFVALVKKGTVILSEEHVDFRWCDYSTARDLLAWEGQKKSLEIIFKYLTEEKKYFDLVEIKFQ